MSEESSSSEGSSSEEEEEELNEELIESLLNQIKDMRTEENFDLKSSIFSLKNLIYDKFMNSIKLCSSIYSALSFKFDAPTLKKPNFISSEQTKELNSFKYMYNQLFLCLFNHPEELAKIIYSEVKRDKSSVSFIAYTLIPTFYNYFVCTICLKKAQEFYAELISFVELEPNDDKETMLNILLPIFSSFFMGAYNFHDLLWNHYYDKFNIHHDIPTPDRFLQCLKFASSALVYQIPLLKDLFVLSNDFGRKFLINGVLKPSLAIYKNTLSGTKEYDSILQLFTNGEDFIQNIHDAFFSYQSDLQYHHLDIININFGKGIPLTMNCESLAQFIRMLPKCDDPQNTIISNKYMENTKYEGILKSISKVEEFNNYTISFLLYYNFPQSNVPKTDNKIYHQLWENINEANKKMPSPLSFESLINSIDTNPSIESPQKFKLYVLRQELKALKYQKLKLEYVITLTLINESFSNFEKVLKNFEFNIFFTLFHNISSKLLGIPPSFKPAKVISTYINAKKSLQKLGIDDDSLNLPLFYTILDFISLPSLDKHNKEFKQFKWNFQNNVQVDKQEELKIIKKEIDLLGNILKDIVYCPFGQMFNKLINIINSISSISEISNNFNNHLDPVNILSASFPIKDENISIRVINSILFIIQTRNTFASSNISLEIFPKLDFINSWLMSLLSENSLFFTKYLLPEITKSF